MRVVSFGFDPELLEGFVRFEEELYAADPIWQRLPRRDARGQLSPENAFFAQGGEHTNLVALEGDRPRGRLTAMTSPRLTGEEGQRVGLIGFYECEDDPAVSAALLEAAGDWLTERGVAQTLGPMDFSTWYRYRFVTEGAERGPFLLEPYNKPWYPAQFEAAGFRPYQTYATLRLPHLPVPLLERAYRRASDEGVRFAPLDPDRAETQLPVFFGLARRIFAGKTAYSAITWDEFQRLYAGMSTILAPGLSWLAYDAQGEPRGFLFAYPDLLEPLRAGDPEAPITTTVLKTIAADPAAPWLGWALTHLHQEAARDQGFAWGLYALMEKWEELGRYAERTRKRTGEDTGGVFKRYALYAR